MRRLMEGFWKEEHGSVAILFALTSIVLFSAIAVAVDGSRAYSLKSRVVAAQDASALAAAKWMVEYDATDEQIKKVAKDYFTAHMGAVKDWDYKLNGFDVDIDRDGDSVTVSANWTVNSMVGDVIGKDKIKSKNSTTATYGLKEIELGLMLDVSGSMAQSGKLDALKTAAKELLGVLLPTSGKAVNKTRVALAPYATSINAGAYAAMAKDNNANNNGNGNGQEKCVSERKGSDAFTDQPPVNGKFFGGKPVDCPDNEVLSLTNDRAVLETSIDSYNASGATAGHLGIGWAWYLVSPEWKDMWPSESEPKPYDEDDLIKAIVVMTDGMFNTEYEIENGTSSVQALALCENIKAKNVRVFTVAFDAPSEVVPLLKSCASSEEHHFDAANSAELKTAFKKIAEDLTAMRLSN